MKKAKIVYVEDNEQNFYLVNFLLSARGHDVVWSKDGQSGIEAISSQPVDLVLLDIQLPHMDGYAVARELRANPRLGDVPIVALTSYAMPGDREKALDAGCTGYIEKPLNPATFTAQIEEFLGITASKPSHGHDPGS